MPRTRMAWWSVAALPLFVVASFCPAAAQTSSTFRLSAQGIASAVAPVTGAAFQLTSSGTVGFRSFPVAGEPVVGSVTKAGGSFTAQIGFQHTVTGYLYPNDAAENAVSGRSAGFAEDAHFPFKVAALGFAGNGTLGSGDRPLAVTLRIKVNAAYPARGLQDDIWPKVVLSGLGMGEIQGTYGSSTNAFWEVTVAGHPQVSGVATLHVYSPNRSFEGRFYADQIEVGQGSVTTPEYPAVVDPANPNVRRSSTVFHSAPYALELVSTAAGPTPYEFKFALTGGQAVNVTVSLWIMTGESAAPSLTLTGKGITGSSVTPVPTTNNQNWVEYHVIPTGTPAKGVMTLTVTSSGAGSVYVDDVTVSE